MTANEKLLSELIEDVKSWSELKLQLSKYNTVETEDTKKNTKAGKLFELFAKLCFEHDANFKEEYNIRQAYLYDELTDELKQRLRIADIEHGIDLILLNHDDQTIAVQCKFKNDERVKLNWNSEKLGNFFGFAKNANFHIVFSNTSDITDVAKNLTEDFKFLGYSYLKDISSETFQSIRNALAKRADVKIEKPKPRPYQEEAIAAVINHFKERVNEKENDRGQLILPCGAGKTLTSLWIKERLKAKNTLVLVPSLALLRQIKKEWNKSYNEKFIRLNVCSEKDIDKEQNVDNDAPIVHSYEIPGNVTSDKNIIAEFLKQENTKVVFSTYQSLQAVADALQLLPGFWFDLILADEAHKTAGFEDQNKFTLVHNPDKIRGVKRLYMTATPRIASPELKALHRDRLHFLKDMSNPKVYGKEAYRMTFGKAIEEGILVKYKIIAVGVSDADLKKNIEQNIVLTKTERIVDYAHNYALNIAMEKYKAFHALTFHSRVKFAEKFAVRHLKLVPNIYATSISGSQTTNEREKILDEFKANPKAIVSNARCLTEGVDVPIIDMVYYGDPRNSMIDIVQSAGRALRTDGSKDMGFIVVPIFHKEKETVEQAIEKSQYKNLITVIRSLCDQDEKLEAEINELAWQKENRTQSGTIEFTFSDDETDRIIHFEQIKEKLKKALFNQIIDNLKDPWEIHYKELEEYFKQYGNSNLPARYKTKEGFGLGTWCVAQRVHYNKGHLSETEIKKLEAVNFEFDPDRTQFEKDYQNLLAFKEQNGHVNVPTVGNKLGRRVNKLRMFARRGILSPEKLDRLTAIGFQFVFREKNWDDHFENLKNYYQTHNIKQVNSAIDSTLYFFERRQRQMKIKGVLEQEKIDKLNSIGFDWNIILNTNESNWHEKYQLLKKYHEKNGTSNVPSSATEFKELRRFISNNKANYHRGRLKQEKIDLLNQIEFDFTSYKSVEQRESDWNNMYQQMVNYKNTYGSYNIPSTLEFKDLVKWIKYQRQALRNDTLSLERINLLNEIQFPWAGRIFKNPKKEVVSNEERWHDMYEQLYNFKQLHNTCIIPNNAEFKELRNWTLSQRSNFKTNNLSELRIQKLNEIDFPWVVGKGVRPKKESEKSRNKVSHETTWMNMFESLKDYYSRHQTFVIDKIENRLLSTWCNTQRTKYNSGNLSEERTGKLNSIDFPWKQKRGRLKTKMTIEKVSRDEQWEAMYEELCNFYNLYQHFNIPENQENSKLLSWINTQIIYKRKGKITRYRLSKLNSINFTWSKAKVLPDGSRLPKALSPKQEAQWLKMFDKLFSFIIKNGHSTIPRDNKDNERLSHWLIKQRKDFRDNKLPEEKIEKLKRINVDLAYSRKNDFDKIWMMRYEQLKEFHSKFNHSNVPGRWKENKTLAQWVLMQRMEKRKNQLEDFKIDLLNQLDFTWNRQGVVKGSFPKDDQWMIWYSQLKKFKKENGHCNVSQSDVENKRLGKWLNDQRTLYKGRANANGSKIFLREDRRKLLEEIGVVWDAQAIKNDELFETRFTELLEFKKIYGHLKVPQKCKEFPKLGTWLSQIKYRGTTPERLARLNEIGISLNSQSL